MRLLARRSYLLVLPPLFLLTGCLKNQFRLQPNPPPELTAKKGSNDLLAPGWLQRYHDQLAKGNCPDNTPPTGPAKDQCANGTYTAVIQGQRNTYISAITSEIDESYDNFKGSLYAGHAYLNVASDLAVLGMSGAGSVIADAGIKSILAAASGGVVGATASVDKQVLNQQNMLAIIAVMDAQRTTQIAVIGQHEKTSITDYPMEAALVDLRTYYVQGTVLSALQGIQATAQQQQSKALSVINKTGNLNPESNNVVVPQP